MPMTRCLRLGLVWAVALVVAGCAGITPPEDRAAAARSLAASAGLAEAVVPAGPFTLTTFSRTGRPGEAVRVYIEGDGMAWRTRHRLSSDPTPISPVALRLAAADPAPNVVYIGRPCQYGGARRDAACESRYWSSHRFAPEVVAAVGAVVDDAVRRAGADRVDLVGFSGGGAVAALLAAERRDIGILRTVAGNLDIARTAALHDVTPLSGSLNPVARAAALCRTPQLHFSGGEDKVIPPVIASGFVDSQRPCACAVARTVAGADHARGWVTAWQTLLSEPAPCTRGSIGTS